MPALCFAWTVGVSNTKHLPKEEAEILLLLVALRCFAERLKQNKVTLEQKVELSEAQLQSIQPWYIMFNPQIDLAAY